MAGKRELVVLLTNYFPFHRGEEYIESELPYLLERFERVLVVPVMHEDHMEQTRTLPDGVEVLAVHMPSSKVARVLHGVRNAPAAAASGMMRGTQPPTHPRRFAFDWYFTTRGLEFWKRVEQPLREAIGNAREVAIYSYWLFIPAFTAMKLRRKLGDRATRVVSRAHNYDVNLQSNPLEFLPQRRVLVEALDAVHPVSDAGRQSLLVDVPDLADRISVRRLGVRSPQGQGPRAHRPQLELISCSTLRYVKRLPLLIDSLADLAARGVPFRWTHFGGAGEELQTLKDLAGSKLPEASFQFMGHVPNAELLAHYASAPLTAFVNVSSAEGVPVSIMEAMAHGLPAVATLAGGTGELVEDGRNGWTLPVEVEAAQIADVLERVWQLSDDEYQRFVRAAHETWANGWSAEKVYREFAAELAGEGVG